MNHNACPNCRLTIYRKQQPKHQRISVKQIFGSTDNMETIEERYPERGSTPIPNLVLNDPEVQPTPDNGNINSNYINMDAKFYSLIAVIFTCVILAILLSLIFKH